MFNEQLEVRVKYLLTAVAWLLCFEIANKWNNVQILKMSLINATLERFDFFRELILLVT